MAQGLPEVAGTIDLAQFWPVGESDADTMKVKVAPGAFRFRAQANAPSNVTAAFENGAMVQGKARTAAIDKEEASIGVTMRIACMLFLLFTTACACLPVPSTDPTPATAGLRIEYRVPGGARVMKTFLPGDPNVTINASKDDVISVLYSGGDEQGVRKVELEYDIWRQIGCCSTQQGLVIAKYQEASCPKATLFKLESFDPAGTDWSYKFTTRADNWVGASTRTATVTVQTQ